MGNRKDLIIFSDLDACLLDHDGYSWTAARPALELIRAESISLVLVTSKTRAEVEAIQRELALDEAFAVENGGGIFFPTGSLSAPLRQSERLGRYEVVRLGRPYAEIRRFVAGLPERLGVTGFGDLSVDDVRSLTGLNSEAAERARRRDFTEPFLLADEGLLPELTDLALTSGLEITRGGRFFHLMAAGQDKGEAVRRCRKIFEHDRGLSICSIGLGDSPNDLPLLHQVDLPIVVPNAAGRHLETGLHDAIEAPHPGSRGWNESVSAALERLGVSGPDAAPAARLDAAGQPSGGIH